MAAAPYGNETALMYAIWKQPVVSVGIDASSNKFQLYSSGVYNVPTCKRRSDLLDHGVSLIGYGTSKAGVAYWIVKNSWNSMWGMEGYIWMSKDKANQCGIATDATYALI
jgi:cathepsin L